jgi:PAS domain S-box-containing protein
MSTGKSDSDADVTKMLDGVVGMSDVKRLICQAQKHQSRLRGITDALAEGLLVQDARGYITFANPEATALLGWDEAELIGRNAHEAIHTCRQHDAPPPTLEQCPIQTAIRSGKRFIGEVFFQRKDGGTLPVSVSVAVFRNDSDVSEAVIAFRSIAEQLETRHKLKETLRELSVILNSAQVGISFVKGRQVVWVNKHMKQMFGYRTREIRNKSTRMFYPDDETYEAVERVAYRRLAEGKTFDQEFKLQRKNGDVFWCQMRGAAIDSSDMDKGTIWILLDISEHKRAEEALRKSEELWKFALEGANEGVWDWNIQTGAATFSKRWKEMLGFAENEIENSADEWIKRVHPEDMPGVMAGLQAHLEGKTSTAVVEFRALCKDGSWKWILGRGMVVGRDADGKPLRLVGTNADITERKQAEARINDLNETLEQRVVKEIAKRMEQERLLIQQSRLAAMGEMIGNIAHQWRQPIDALNLLLANIKDAYEFHELDKESLDREVESGRELIQRMSATIDDFRDFFRPNKEKETFQAIDGVEAALKLLGHSFKNNNIEVICGKCAEPCSVFGYSSEFAQVVLNALTNAKEAIVARGVVGLVQITLQRDANSVTVIVRDNGGGIAEEILGKVFDPYFTTKEKGTGIGLYMSKTIMENMGGGIAIRSVDGGAEVLLTLPTAEPTV